MTEKLRRRLTGKVSGKRRFYFAVEGLGKGREMGRECIRV